MSQPFDLFIIGGGINGCGIARDAAGRGLSVALAEQNDLASGTSSASTKMFHGGLRYLEYFKFRLVREALEERETLLRAMPHIAWPMRFVLPYTPQMRFESCTPASRLLGVVMPWMRGRRPAWMIRLGLFLYDSLGGRQILAATRKLDLRKDPAGRALRPEFQLGYEYSDCWVQDARLVALNARHAEELGAKIMPQTKVLDARRENGLWHITIAHEGQSKIVQARALVNAAGPWVRRVIDKVVHLPSNEGVRLVRGSHIVVPKLYDHDRCYFFQGRDGRVIFAIPYENDFTLIGTTDQDHQGPPETVACSQEERDYLCAFASEYFAKPVLNTDVVWTYSGVRPLYDDGATSASAATRDYVLSLEDEAGLAPILHVFGGKITTYRRLAENALRKLAPYLVTNRDAWTAGAPLPGGDFALDAVETMISDLTRDYPFIDAIWAKRLIRSYGTEARLILAQAQDIDALGQNFGATLTAAEVDWLVEKEYAQNADDILWRRSKLGLYFDQDRTEALAAYLSDKTRQSPPCL